MARSFAYVIILSLSLLGQALAGDTLYADLGERPNLVRVVDDATNRWLADPRIKDTFDDINIDRFKGRLVDQLCEVSGGPCHYTGRNMYQAHKGLHLDTAQFNALVEGLESAMDDCGIGFRTQNRLLAVLAPMERDVVTK